MTKDELKALYLEYKKLKDEKRISSKSAFLFLKKILPRKEEMGLKGFLMQVWMPLYQDSFGEHGSRALRTACEMSRNRLEVERDQALCTFMMHWCTFLSEIVSTPFVSFHFEFEFSKMLDGIIGDLQESLREKLEARRVAIESQADFVPCDKSGTRRISLQEADSLIDTLRFKMVSLKKNKKWLKEKIREFTDQQGL